jgi:predicted TIM-barrel fold metal-dependent hydrolase
LREGSVTSLVLAGNWNSEDALRNKYRGLASGTGCRHTEWHEEIDMRTFDVHVHYNGNIDLAEQFVSAWKAAGIEKAVVFGLTKGDGWHPSLEQVAQIAAKYPDFIIPFGYITPGNNDDIGQAREAIARGFRGLKFIFASKPYDEDEFFPIYEAAAKAGMVCLFHTGIVIGGTAPSEYAGDYQRAWRISSNFMRPGNLDRIARAFPQMTIIGAHIGGGAWYEEACQLMRWNLNVYFDLSIGQLHYVRRNIPEGQEARAIKPRLQEMYDTGQLDLKRIMFGTDGVIGKEAPNPGWALLTLQFELDAVGATEEEKEAVRWSTAARLLGVK